MIVLTDEFSASAGDIFPALIQDSQRGPLFGYRTNGAGGGTTSYDTGVFSETFVTNTIGLLHSGNPVVTPEYPASNYIENVGVRPDIPYDFMTRENLLDAGRPFVRAFTEAMVEHIRQSGGGQ